MQEITDYGKVFETLVQKTQDYIVGNNLSAMVLGISGGIDSTVVAAICHEVSKRTNIPLIGRSLPTTNNKTNEVSTADLVGKAFCTDYKVCPIDRFYHQFMIDIVHKETGSVRYKQNELTGGFTIDLEDCLKFQTPIANGNIQARLRMIYLYNLASIHRGLVMDTDNLTENNLGYFTIHGDVGDFNPIGGLWKTEVFKLAEWLISYYRTNSIKTMEKSGLVDYSEWEEAVNADSLIYAIEESLKLKPTAGLGITNNDLEEIGAESYDQVDDVLKVILAWKMITVPSKYNFNNFIESDFISELTYIPEEIIESANLDGATGIKEFWYIVLPMAYGTLSLFIVTGVAGIFLAQYAAYDMYGGYASTRIQGVGYWFYVSMLNRFSEVSRSAELPYYAALGVCLTFITLPLMFITKWATEKFGPSEE